jgi:glycosyltransferase involved in cell wall biosynthesis
MKNIINNIGEEIQLVGFELEVFNILKKKLPNFKQYLFVIYGNNGNDLPLSRYIQHDKKILIWRSNENKLNRVDELKKDYKHIFTNYYFDNKNSTSLQLGYHTQTKNKEIIPITERLFNLSFTGCLNRNRVQLASILSNIPIKWIAMGMVFNKKLILKIINGLIKWKFNKDYFQFNDGFNNGLNEEDYNFILRNTKIALCPKGWVNQETFRLYESMKWGCVVISEDLPNRSYYKGIPIIKVKDWNEGIEIANRLIEDTNELERLSKKNIQFYKDNLSPEATANLIIGRITKKGSGK